MPLIFFLGAEPSNDRTFPNTRKKVVGFAFLVPACAAGGTSARRRLGVSHLDLVTILEKSRQR